MALRSDFGLRVSRPTSGPEQSAINPPRATAIRPHSLWLATWPRRRPI
ncbi:hypothetical protein [Lysobacter gummosus]